MRTEYYKQIAKDIADTAASLGFEVYLAERGTYGFITDGKCVVGFDADRVGPASLSGNHYPPSKDHGTGWIMGDYAGEVSIKNAMQARSPYGKKLTTPEQYLEMYQSSSKFAKVNTPA